jgi:hypothetical protein
MLFGWLSVNPGADTVDVLSAMAAALRADVRQEARIWTSPGFGIGLIERAFAVSLAGEAPSREPVRTADGTSLWMAGEAFDWPSHGGLDNAAASRRIAFRRRLLDALRDEGPAAIRDLDGEYQIALWTPSSRTLLLLNDRFGALSLYTASSADGVAFAGGVRGVLTAPGIACEPDLDAIREAVTFGGFRLGSRTNIRDITMVPPSSGVTLSSRTIEIRRYWTWSALPQPDGTDRSTLLEETRGAWQRAIARRLDGAGTPGLTLSGGLDSRAILAEAHRQGRHLAALTYGVPESDDVKIARRAASAAGTAWTLYPLYSAGWLERRADRIQQTDGLVDLVDLMHAEPLEQMPQVFDTYLSGYIGDAVTGSTLFSTHNAADLVASMPYYGGTLGLSYESALARAEDILARTPGPARFAPYEHKLVQSTNRITDAARPFVTVRRPFVDYAFFEIAQRVPAAWRNDHAWHEQWLRSTYPRFYARIPNQRTAVPVQSSRLRWQLTRTARFGWRRALSLLRARGVPVTVPQRYFHPDESYWSMPEARRVIEETILRSGSLSCEALGRDAVRSTLKQFFDERSVAVQVVGAMFVFEHYHRALASFLADARSKGALIQC